MPWQLGLVLWIATANAQTTDAPPPNVAPPVNAPPPPIMAPPVELLETEGYRSQIIVADVVSLVLAASESKVGLSVAGLTYLLGGPIIHNVHGQKARVVGSLALRLSLPLIGAVGGRALANSRTTCTESIRLFCDDDADIAGLFFGFSAGVLAAMIIDTAAIARPVRVRRNTSVTWAPRLDVTSQHAQLGIAGCL